MKIEGSSHINRAEYNAAEKTLVVGFTSGTATKYLNVPEHKWKGFQEAESKGKYLHANIRGEHHAFPVKEYQWKD